MYIMYIKFYTYFRKKIVFHLNELCDHNSGLKRVFVRSLSLFKMKLYL